MKKSMIVLCGFLLTTPVYSAQQLTDQAMELAQNGLITSDANGDEQTTVIDAGGNLKMVPMDDVPSASNKSGKKGQSGKNKKGKGAPDSTQEDEMAPPAVPSPQEGQTTEPPSSQMNSKGQDDAQNKSAMDPGLPSGSAGGEAAPPKPQPDGGR